MANNRIFYACQAIAIAPAKDDNGAGNETFIEVHGVQSVGINTSFNLEQIFELGQISIYENIEGVPDVEVTVEKILDGYPLAYRLATKNPNETDPGTALVNRTKNRCSLALGIYPDDKEAVSGTAPIEVYMSGFYVNSLSYTFPTDGNCTESVTFVGNHKLWQTTGQKWTDTLAARFERGGDRPWNQAPAVALAAGSGVQRREDVIMMSSIMPKDIYDVNGTGVGNNFANGKPRAHIQSITISTDLGREDILELGRKVPYYRAATFPVEVTSEFEVISVSGDFINAKEDGDNTLTCPIKIVMRDGTEFDLGTKNRLSSVSYGGGDAGGGNATMTYSFVNYNDLSIKGPHNNGGEVTPFDHA